LLNKKRRKYKLAKQTSHTWQKSACPWVRLSTGASAIEHNLAAQDLGKVQSPSAAVTRLAQYRRMLILSRGVILFTEGCGAWCVVPRVFSSRAPR
jgi:hypothetical protein